MSREGSRIGVEGIKTAQTQRVRSIPCRSVADLYLELYMLLKRNERLKKMKMKGRDEHETIQKKQIEEVKAFLRRIEEKPMGGDEAIKKIPARRVKEKLIEKELTEKIPEQRTGEKPVEKELIRKKISGKNWKVVPIDY